MPTLGNKTTLHDTKRLLFVDDEQNIRDTLSIILRRYGFAVTLAATTSEALDKIKTQRFDLLLCDLNIQRDADGYEVVRAMRDVNPGCVIIVLTGFPGLESAVDGIHLAIDDYIVKPANADVLTALLAEKLATRKPKARILSVSYDETLLRMRHMILENAGYSVVSSHGSESSIEQCKQGGFDLFVLGHSIPPEEKRLMVERFRKVCPAPIISLRKGWCEPKVDGADFHIEPDPEPLLELVAGLVRNKSGSYQTEVAAG